MKKVVFMALATVFMLSSGFTNHVITNELSNPSNSENWMVQEDFSCTVRITATRQNQYGETETISRIYRNDLTDDCLSFGNMMMYFMCVELNGINSGC